MISPREYHTAHTRTKQYNQYRDTNYNTTIDTESISNEINQAFLNLKDSTYFFRSFIKRKDDRWMRQNWKSILNILDLILSMNERVNTTYEWELTVSQERRKRKPSPEPESVERKDSRFILSLPLQVFQVKTKLKTQRKRVYEQ